MPAGSAIAGSLPQARRTACANASRTTGSSPTLAAASTSNVGGCGPSWSSHAKVTSKKLWLPTGPGSAASHSIASSGCFGRMESNSWFSMKTWTPLGKQSWQRTCSPSSTFSAVESMEGGITGGEKPAKKSARLKKTDKVPPNVTRKVGLRLTPEQTSIIRGWFGCSRATYNWALACIKSKPQEYRKTDLVWLHKRFVNAVNIPQNRRYLLECPKHIRDGALSDLVNAYKTNFAKMREDPSHQFDISFRRRKDAQRITIQRANISAYDPKNGAMSIYPMFLKDKITFAKQRHQLPDTLDYACNLLLDRLGRVSVTLSYYEKPKELDASAGENQASERGGSSSGDSGSSGTVRDSRHAWCALDPGVRTIYTAYSPTPGVAYKLGDGDAGRIYRMCTHLDKLVSVRWAKDTPGKRRRRLARAEVRMRARIRNLVTEVHCKVVRFLVRTFQNIILPPFNVSGMVRRVDRRIQARTVRQMLAWRHYDLKQRLLQAAARSDCHVHIRGEHYTSKTCTCCMHVKHNLGGAKVYKCSECRVIMDRDLNGARNIFLKNTHASEPEFRGKASQGPLTLGSRELPGKALQGLVAPASGSDFASLQPDAWEIVQGFAQSHARCNCPGHSFPCVCTIEGMEKQLVREGSLTEM